MRNETRCACGLGNAGAGGVSGSGGSAARRYDRVHAADVRAAVYNWTGFYIGINGGGAWGDSKWTSVGTFDVSGAMVGGTVGYNWQFGSPVGVRP